MKLSEIEKAITEVPALPSASAVVIRQIRDQNKKKVTELAEGEKPVDIKELGGKALYQLRVYFKITASKHGKAVLSTQ